LMSGKSRYKLVPQFAQAHRNLGFGYNGQAKYRSDGGIRKKASSIIRLTHVTSRNGPVV
jgi:hypothetical protein